MRVRVGPLTTMKGVAKWVEVETPSRLNAGSHAHSTAAITTRQASARPALASRYDQAARRSRSLSNQISHSSAVIARFADAGSPFPKIPTLESASWKAGADAGCHERCHPEHFRKSAGRQTPPSATSPTESGFADREVGFRSQPGRS